MKNKLIVNIFFLFFLMTVPLFSQEHDVTDTSETLISDASVNILSPNLLIQSNNRFNILSFQFPDGTPVSRKEANILFNTVPANQDILRKMRHKRIASWFVAGLGIASGVVLCSYLINEDVWSGADIVIPVSIGSVLASTMTVSFINTIETKRFLQAADNYNLHILGIPIRGR